MSYPYLSHVAWVDSGRAMSRWEPEDREEEDIEHLQRAATKPQVYPADRPEPATSEPKKIQTIPVSQLVGKFLI